jgi:RNA polymerase sigma-70 factor (sigma-E family)
MRDEAAFTAFVVARGPALLRLGWLLTADADAAQDLVQEALARVVPKWDKIAIGAREAYLRTTIRSVWVDGWRRRRGAWLDAVPDLPEVAAVRDDADGAAARLTLDAALARLTPRQRAVLVLRFYEDLSEADTAAALGCSNGTVKSQTSHALGRLRTLAPELAEAFGREHPAARLTQEVSR